jgi:hypothetical protein
MNYRDAVNFLVQKKGQGHSMIPYFGYSSRHPSGIWGMILFQPSRK